jgi:hypothetical protein
MKNPNTHNRLVKGSNPAESTSEAELFKKSLGLIMHQYICGICGDKGYWPEKILS